MSGRRHYLLALLVLSVASQASATSQYKSLFQTYYCPNSAGYECNVYWPMDETSGTTLANQCTTDLCAAQVRSYYDLTTINGPSLNQAAANPEHGPSVHFDASSTQYAENNAYSSGDGPGDYSRVFTTGCWAKIDTSVNGALISTNQKAFGTGTPGILYSVWGLYGGYSTSRIIAFEMYHDTDPGTYLSYGTVGTVTTNTWHFYVAVWDQVAQKVTLYFDATSQGTSAAGSGQTPNAIRNMDLGVKTFSSTPNKYTGYSSDCYIISYKQNLAQITTLYEVGTESIDNWPYNVKAPVVPKFRNPGYEDKLVDRGYTTGLWATKTLRPDIFSPYIALAAIPDGNVH